MNPPETLKKTAEALVSGCREGRETEMLGLLYDPDAVSIEAYSDGEGEGRVAEGLDAIRAKHKWWNETFETLDGTTRGPLLHGEDRFSVIFEVTARRKDSGETIQMLETATYTIGEDGKIVREEFFYTP